MLQPQELVVAKLLPTIRARLARELLRTYKKKQIDVARAMGITQAAVSHYNTQSRGVDQEMLRLFPEITPFVQGLAESIADGMTLSDQIARVNQFCSNLMLTARFASTTRGWGTSIPTARRVFLLRRGRRPPRDQRAGRTSCKARISASTIVRTRSLKRVFVSQPRIRFALLASPRRLYTSEGRRFLSSIVTCFSQSEMPARRNASATNSRTECDSPVAPTKSSGSRCWSTRHMRSTYSGA